MKKIFTLAAAVLASFSLMAADQFISVVESDGVYTYDGSEIKAKSGPVLVEVPSAEVSGTITVFGSSDKNDRFLYVNEDPERKMVMVKAGASADFTPADIVEVEEKPYLRLTTSDDFKFKKLEYTVSGSTPVVVNDPVAKVEIAGPTEAFVGQKASFTATTDVKANAYKWFVNEAEQEGATTAKFDFVAEAAGNYSIVCQAKNDNNSDFVASEAIVLVASEKAELAQVEVSEATVWDWSKAGAEEIKFATKDEEILLADVSGIANNADFNSQALLVKGEYAVRSGSFFQGSSIKFTTTVAGFVRVSATHTSSSKAARVIRVNDLIEEQQLTDTKTVVVSKWLEVAAGEVMIWFSEADSDDSQYARVQKVEFSLTDPTAINNMNVEKKAVKVVRNGQLFIEMNGVLYNAQGTIVK